MKNTTLMSTFNYKTFGGLGTAECLPHQKTDALFDIAQNDYMSRPLHNYKDVALE